MARLGKRERKARKAKWQEFRRMRAVIVANNLSEPKPERVRYASMDLRTFAPRASVAIRRLYETDKAFVK